MKISDINYLKNNGKHIDIIKHKDNTVWKRHKKEFGENPGVILEYTASDTTTLPYELLHGSSNYTTSITGDGPYTYTISTDDIEDLPTKISFKNCTNLLTVDYICDTSQISDMSRMFKDCTNLTSIEFDGFDVSNVTTMDSMFWGCSSLEDVDFFSFKNRTTKLTNTSWMFYECESLTSLYLSTKIDTSNVVDMSYMFAKCTSLTNLSPGSYFSTESATSTTSMFLNCDALKEVDFSYRTTTNTIEDVVKLLVSHYGSDDNEYVVDIIDCKDEVKSEVIASLGNKYRGWTIWVEYPEEPDEPDEPSSSGGTILTYTASDNTTTPYELLHGSSNYTTSITGYGPYTYTVKTDDIADLPTRISFKDCTNLLTVDYMCDTSQITDMSSMFENCKSLRTICNFNTSNVTNMSYMFASCLSLTESAIPTLNTSKVTKMQGMFEDCQSLKEFNISRISRDKSPNMDNMFYACTNLEVLYLSQSSNLIPSMNGIISGCSSLKELYLYGTTPYVYSVIGGGMPTGTVNGQKRKLYCSSDVYFTSALPSGWERA